MAFLGDRRLTPEEGEFLGRLLVGRLAESLSKVLGINLDKVADKLKYMNQYFTVHSNEPAPLLTAEEFATKVYWRFHQHYEESGGLEGMVLQGIYNDLVAELGMDDLQVSRK